MAEYFHSLRAFSDIFFAPVMIGGMRFTFPPYKLVTRKANRMLEYTERDGISTPYHTFKMTLKLKLYCYVESYKRYERDRNPVQR